jgi:hypothetical protein
MFSNVVKIKITTVENQNNEQEKDKLIGFSTVGFYLFVILHFGQWCDGGVYFFTHSSLVLALFPSLVLVSSPAPSTPTGTLFARIWGQPWLDSTIGFYWCL